MSYAEWTCSLCGQVISTRPGSVNRCNRPVCEGARIAFYDPLPAMTAEELRNVTIVVLPPPVDVEGGA